MLQKYAYSPCISRNLVILLFKFQSLGPTINIVKVFFGLPETIESTLETLN